MLNALIIDDEIDARNALEVLLTKFVKDVNVVGQASGVKTGIEQINSLNPDVVFLDINMEDGTGFDLLDELSEIKFHLVFVTAFNQYAIKAFKYTAFDYLLKPVDLQELRKCVERLNSIGKVTVGNTRMQELRTTHKSGQFSKITLPNLGGFDVVDIEEIIRCEGQKNYTTFYLKDNRKLVVSKTLKEYELILQEHNFLRVYQSHLINLKCIKQYQKGRGGTVVMEDGSEIPVSREKKEVLLRKIKM